jgi:hypothetical protein
MNKSREVEVEDPNKMCGKLGSHNLNIIPIVTMCHNPSLGLATKAMVYKVAGQKGNLGVTSCALESAKKCEGMNLHTPK